jgi:tetratricopeptide (TPR) repeat protein
MTLRVQSVLPAALGATPIILLIALPLSAARREEVPPSSKVEVHAGREGCKVDVDSVPAGETNAQGELAIESLEPGDHYVHVRCGTEQEKSYFISPSPGATAGIKHFSAAPQESPPVSGLQMAQTKIQLRKLLQEAARLRARGRIEEAITHLRDAYRLDPDNSDLHREMGMTFLLAKEWERARVEMLETIHHEPDDAEAHNGLGYALEKMGEIAGALAEYRTASHLDPTDSSYRRRYIDALAKLSALQATKKK